MSYFNAFKGSKAALDKNKIMIVRGISQDRINIEDIPSKIECLVKELDAEEVEVDSEKGMNIVKVMDNHIRAVETIDTESEPTGIANMKADYESMNQYIEIRELLLKGVAVFLTVWKDKSNVGPMFVEAVVSEMQVEELNEPVSHFQASYKEK